MSEPLVLIMGKFCDARVFQSQIAEFSQERMVIVPPVFYGERIGDYTASILSMLPEKFAVMGHDLGGYVAMEMLRKRPIGWHALVLCPQIHCRKRRKTQR